MGDRALVRDAKANDASGEPNSSVLDIPGSDWSLFLEGVVADRPGEYGTVSFARLSGGWWEVRQGSVRLYFDAGEWSAFSDGVSKGEFELGVPV